MPQAQSTTGRPTAASLRTGAEYLRSLNDGRKVFLDGEAVGDVSRHKAFREAARSVARLYDIAAAPENRDLMTFASPKTGAPTSGGGSPDFTAWMSVQRGVGISSTRA